MKKSVITSFLFVVLSLSLFSSAALATDETWQIKDSIGIYSLDKGDISCRINEQENGTLEVLGVEYGEDKTICSHFFIHKNEASGYIIESETKKGIWATPSESSRNIFRLKCLPQINKKGLTSEIREVLKRAIWKK